ncbi:MAG: hypothetical protein WDN72_05445 [Alphaproteobacteria bacterium]
MPPPKAALSPAAEPSGPAPGLTNIPPAPDPASHFDLALRWLREKLGGKSEGTLKTIIEDALEEDSAEGGMSMREEERTLLKNMMHFGELTVRDVMIPRMEITGIRRDVSLDELKSHVIEMSHTRIPVYDDSLDKIEGFIHVKDLFPYLAAGRISRSARCCARCCSCRPRCASSTCCSRCASPPATWRSWSTNTAAPRPRHHGGFVRRARRRDPGRARRRRRINAALGRQRSARGRRPRQDRADRAHARRNAAQRRRGAGGLRHARWLHLLHPRPRAGQGRGAEAARAPQDRDHRRRPPPHPPGPHHPPAPAQQSAAA